MARGSPPPRLPLRGRAHSATLTAAADVFNPDVVQRRRFTKAKRKRGASDASIRADEALLDDTGIRVLRDKPVFTTPNVYPPKAFDAG